MGPGNFTDMTSNGKEVTRNSKMIMKGSYFPGMERDRSLPEVRVEKRVEEL